MGEFSKKSIIREAENIIEEFSDRRKEEKKQIVNLKKSIKKVKRINIALKVIIAIMTVCVVMLIIT